MFFVFQQVIFLNFVGNVYFQLLSNVLEHSSFISSYNTLKEGYQACKLSHIDMVGMSGFCINYDENDTQLVAIVCISMQKYQITLKSI